MKSRVLEELREETVDEDVGEGGRRDGHEGHHFQAGTGASGEGSLQDSLATAESRKDNLAKSRGNAEFVQTELDRLENKIQAVTEMAVSHTDPDEVSSKIDAISEGISQTEQTIRDLQNLTGMVADAEVPAILGAEISVARPPPTPVVVNQGRRRPGE